MTEDAWGNKTFAAAWDDAGNARTNPDRARQLALVADLVAATRAARLLDLGIGSAQLESVIARRHGGFLDRCRVTGVDSSAAMLDLATRRCELEGLPNVELRMGDFARLEDLALDEGPDTVVCVQALHEVTDASKRRAFAQVAGLMRPGGSFYIADRFRYPGASWLDDWRATWDWMREGVDTEVMDFDSYHYQYSRKTDYVASVDDYLQWLRDVGLEAHCVYRSFNRAVIAARKGVD